MPDSNSAFKYLDDDAIEKLAMRSSPYEWGYIDDAIPQKFKEELLSDAPIITTRGSYGIRSYFGMPHLKYCPHFGKIVEDLLSDHFRKIVAKKMNMDLSNNPSS